MSRKRCNCFSQYSTEHGDPPKIHGKPQNTQCDAWQRLLELVEVAGRRGAKKFEPLREFTPEERADIITLPPTIAKLKSVKYLNLYGSSLVRIPPEIGEMESLVEFIPYTSYLLHWFPYEITRCRNLKSSIISTRALYGNYKFRPPFPDLRQAKNFDVYSVITPNECSICRAKLDLFNVYRRWISLPVATDVLPLLVNACSMACVESLPKTPANYISGSHIGGCQIQQPPPDP